MNAAQAEASEVKDYKWKHITPLSEEDKKIDLAGISALYASWKNFRTRMEQGGMSLKEFNERLVRRLSIETGILEKLYDLDRGTTETLIVQGFAENLVSRSDTNIEPSSLIDILKDQEAAIQHAMSYVAGKSPLTKQFIHELHAMLVRHQDTTEAVNTLGNRSVTPLLKGKYKEYPNNPRRADGGMHEYCPPLHVETEMENLLGWYAEYSGIDPVIVAAWLHHRFTQIHPYQDGNGRLARILTTMVFVHHDLLPVVVERDDRVRYIAALERADAGDLTDFVSILAGLEKDAILRALRVEVEVEADARPSLTGAVFDKIKSRIQKRLEQQVSDLRRVNAAAQALQQQAGQSLRKHLEAFQKIVEQLGKTDYWIDDVKPGDGNYYWYRSDVIESAKGKKSTDAEATSTFVNFSEDHYFTKASFEVNRQRLDFIVSFHHVGRELSGIMEATAFSRFRTRDGESSDSELFICSQTPIGPFVFTNETKTEEIEKSFSLWLDEVFAVAVNQYSDRI